MMMAFHHLILLAVGQVLQRSLEPALIAKSIGGGAAKFKAAAAALLAAAVLVTSTGSLAFSNNKLAYAADLSD
ncbi:hypothetical protein, partial [Bifidobacterium breve]|uniref:hypothetical protein n=1 Tax=Bifidobacterium breve TaxID=1685 RepID=UPI00114622A9